LIPDDMWSIFAQVFQTNENYTYHVLKLLYVLLNCVDKLGVGITDTESEIHPIFYSILNSIFDLFDQASYNIKVEILKIISSEFRSLKRGRTDLMIQFFEQRFQSFDPLISLLETEDYKVLYSYLIDGFLWIIGKLSVEYLEWKTRILELIRLSPGLYELLSQYCEEGPSEQIEEASAMILSCLK